MLDATVMKPRILLCLALVAFNLAAQARVTRAWSDTELEQAADLVVVGRPIQARDLEETNSLGWDQSESFRPRFRGVETTFEVSDVLKGRLPNDHVVLHHYREVLEWGNPPNGPTFLSFTPNSTNKYLLYLIKDGTNRYAPAAGQIDTGDSIKPATNHSSIIPFPVRPPLADANPFVRHSVSIRVPTKIKVVRSADTLSVEIDTNLFESTNLLVAKGMVTSIEYHLFIYPVAEARPKEGGSGLSGDFNLGVRFWHTKQDNIPLPWKRYVVEMDLAIFETDIPAQHFWSPQGSKNYKVLWRRTLKQID